MLVNSLKVLHEPRFLPMNPSFQKTVLGYVALQAAAVIARLGMFDRNS